MCSLWSSFLPPQQDGIQRVSAYHLCHFSHELSHSHRQAPRDTDTNRYPHTYSCPLSHRLHHPQRHTGAQKPRAYVIPYPFKHLISPSPPLMCTPKYIPISQLVSEKRSGHHFLLQVLTTMSLMGQFCSLTDEKEFLSYVQVVNMECILWSFGKDLPPHHNASNMQVRGYEPVFRGLMPMPW